MGAATGPPAGFRICAISSIKPGRTTTSRRTGTSSCCRRSTSSRRPYRVTAATTAAADATKAYVTKAYVTKGVCDQGLSRPSFTFSLPRPRALSPRRHRALHDAACMADLLVVAGIVVFVAAMLGLIWGLERV